MVAWTLPGGRERANALHSPIDALVLNVDLVVRACTDLISVVEEYFAAGGERATRWRDRFVDQVDELRVIGTDESEWLSGAAAFAVFADPSAHVDSKPTVVLDDLEAYAHGDVGWVACRPLLTLPDGTTLTLRWTGVFVRTPEAWRLRQLHVSTG